MGHQLIDTLDLVTMPCVVDYPFAGREESSPTATAVECATQMSPASNMFKHQLIHVSV